MLRDVFDVLIIFDRNRTPFVVSLLALLVLFLFVLQFF